ncbi:MAG: hypothetical protein MAG795_00243 [Candidatus Woesearchaeota archaeon]|nr:hypothetical protein [Candidatus Woesearchaeota archaeon]
MMKKILLFTILIVFALSLSDSVFACSPAPNYISISCTPTNTLDENELPQGYRFYNEKLTLSSGYKFESVDENFDFLTSNCQEDVESVKPELINLFKEYNSKEHRYFTHERTEIVPYDETLIENNKNSRYNPDNVGNCYFENVYKLGDFVVNEGGMRDYCHLTGGGGGMCPHATKLHLQFFGFILTNPNVNTLPYLFGYLIAIGVVIGFIVYLFKRKELKLFFKPNKFNIIFTLVLGIPTFLLFLLFTGIEQIIVWIIGYYIFSSTIKYIYLRLKKK